MIKLNDILTQENINLWLFCGKISSLELATSESEVILKKLLDNIHKFKISASKDGRYTTYVPDQTKPDGRRQVRRNSRADLYAYLIDFYGLTPTKQQKKTFGEVFKEWIEYKRLFTKANYKPLSPSTITRYERDFSRLVANTPLEKAEISIDSMSLEQHLINTITEHQMKPSDARNFYGYFNQMFQFAVRKSYIIADPMTFIDKDRIISFCCSVTPKTDEERILTKKELQALVKSIKKHLSNNPHYAQDYAILFALLTGMRVGEIAALRWDKIDDDFIRVDLAERRFDYDDHSEIIVGEPKNGKHRSIPISADIRELLDLIKENIPSDEWVFAKDNQRISARSIGCAARKRSKEAGIEPTSIHQIRRTVSSYLNTILPREAVAAMLGHLPTTNERFYDYDISEKADKIRALEQMSSKVINFPTKEELKKTAENL